MGRAAVVPLGATLLAALVAGLTPPVAGADTHARATSTHGWIRVNQGGYLPGEPKQARLMATATLHGTTYRVTDRSGAVVLRGRVPARPPRAWGPPIPAGYPLHPSGPRAPGHHPHSPRRG